MRFPLQVVAKSRTPTEHFKYYRWIRLVNNQHSWAKPDVYIGWRTRWFLAAMDLVPTFVWRRLPVRWQTAHLFGDLE